MAAQLAAIAVTFLQDMFATSWHGITFGNMSAASHYV